MVCKVIINYFFSNVRRSTQSLPGSSKADAGLQEKLNAAADADVVVEIAKDAGFVISADELERAQAEVSEEDLEGVTGAGTKPTFFGWNNDQCKY